MKFLRGGRVKGCLTNNISFDYDADPYHDRDSEIFNELFITAG